MSASVRPTQSWLVAIARRGSVAYCCYALSFWAGVTGGLIYWCSGWTIAGLILFGHALAMACLPTFVRDRIIRRRLIAAAQGCVCATFVLIGGGTASPLLCWLLLVPFIASACDDAWAAGFWSMMLTLFLPVMIFTNQATWQLAMPTAEQLEVLQWIGPLGAMLLIALLGAITAAQTSDRDRQQSLYAQQAQLEVAAKRDFLSKMSHELRTPLTAILGFADELAVRANETSSRRAVDSIQRNSRSMLTSLEDLTEWGRIECGAVALKPALYQTSQLLYDAQSALSTLPAPQISNVSVSYDGAIPSHIVTDRLILEKAIVKCAAAALQATGRGGIQLTARVDVEGQLLEIDIGPLGERWEVEELQKLIDRSSAAPTVAGGFSLAIGRGLARLLEGQAEIVHLQTTAGIRLQIPTGSLDKAEMVTPVASGPSSRDATGATKRAPRLDDCRILLVEDSPDTKALISFLLSRAGAEVQGVENGQAAVAAALSASARGMSFDIILMDMQMPVMDGREATERLRRNGYDRPIIAFTAQAIEYTREKCLRAGCDDYITKPFRSHELIDLVARYAQSNLKAVMTKE